MVKNVIWAKVKNAIWTKVNRMHYELRKKYNMSLDKKNMRCELR